MSSAVATFAPDPEGFEPRRFTAHELDLAFEVASELRSISVTPKVRADSEALRVYKEVTGASTLRRSEIIEFCESIDEELSILRSNPITTDEFVEFTHSPTQRTPTMTTSAAALDDNLADDVRTYYRGSAPDSEPNEFRDMARSLYGSPSNSPTVDPVVKNMLGRPGEGIRDPDRMGGIGGRALERARGLSIDLAEVAKSTRVAFQNPMITNPGRDPVFVRPWAEEGARSRAVLQLLAGGADLDPVEVDRIAGSQVVGMWLAMQTGPVEQTPLECLQLLLEHGRSMERGSCGLLEETEAQLAKLDEELPSLGLLIYCEKVNGLLERREEVERHLANIRTSLAEIPGRLANHVGRAFELGGGVARLAPFVRDAGKTLGTFAASDPILDAMRIEYHATVADMAKYRSAAPDLPESPFFEAARAKRDEINPKLQEREVEAERRAYGRLERRLELAIEGNVEALDELIGHVQRVPGAFPADFRTAIVEAPKLALVEGAWGLINALQ